MLLKRHATVHVKVKLLRKASVCHRFTGNKGVFTDIEGFSLPVLGPLVSACALQARHHLPRGAADHRWAPQPPASSPDYAHPQEAACVNRGIGHLHPGSACCEFLLSRHRDVCNGEKQLKSARRKT